MTAGAAIAMGNGAADWRTVEGGVSQTGRGRMVRWAGSKTCSDATFFLLKEVEDPI